MKKDIVLIEDFCGKLDKTDNDRFTYIANMMANENDVELITSNFCHVTKKKFNTIDLSTKYKITLLNEGSYKKNISIKRFISHYFWGRRVYSYLKKRKKPDIIYCAIPTLKAASLAAKYCKRYKIRFVLDVQDLWPEAFKLVFNIPVISRLVFYPFKKMAIYAYKNADEIVAVSNTYLDKTVIYNNKKNLKTHIVYLGTNLNEFDSNSKKNTIITKTDISEIWIGYCGTLGTSYDLNIVFKAMRILNNPKIKFIIMGDGPYFNKFKKESKNLNTLFLGRISYEKMCGILVQCDILVNPISRNAAQSIINKHADYAAAAKPILNTQENDEYRKLIQEYEMGININNNDYVNLSNALEYLINNPAYRMKLGSNSRKCACDKFNRIQTYEEIKNILNS